MANRAMLLLAACLALTVASTLAAEAKGARTLKQLIVSGDFAAQPRWPYCRCDDYSADSNPYILKLTNATVKQPNGIFVGEFCFEITAKPVRPESPSPCYTKLEQRVDKIQFAFQPVCIPSFDVTNRYLTVNNVLKTTGYEIKDEVTGAALKLSNLKLDAGAILGTKVCMRFSYPCNLPENFFDTDPITYVLMESGSHKCCVGV